MKSAVGEQRQAAIIAWLTGSVQATPLTQQRYSKAGPSIDRCWRRACPPGKRKQGLYMAVRWGTARATAPEPDQRRELRVAAPYNPMVPSLDPVAIWQDLFGALPASAGGWDKSCSTSSIAATSSSARGSAPRTAGVLDEHLTRLREIEQRVAATARCSRAGARRHQRLQPDERAQLR
jgi:hypothetical protein